MPCLNGFRAFAIVCVIVSHINESKGSWSAGHFGVTSFFVISGFLITLLLLRERHVTSTVSLSSFYKRRALRILPAYVMLLLVTAALTAVGALRISGLTWLTVLTYTSCFVTLSISPVLAHTWSLSVEEHFYFLWPIILSRAGIKWSARLISLYVLSVPIIRYELMSARTPTVDINYSSFVQMSSIGTGCLLAFLVTGDAPARLSGFVTSHPIRLMTLGCLLMIGSLVTFRSHPVLHDALADPIRAASFGCIMLGMIYSCPGNPITRLLENRFVNYLGVISYSLYLWQQLFTRHTFPILGGTTASLLWLSIAALLSYYFVEKPFLIWKNRVCTKVSLDLKSAEAKILA